MSHGSRSRSAAARWPLALCALPLVLAAACGGQAPTPDIASAGSPSGTAEAAPSATSGAAAPSGKSELYEANLAHTQCMRKEGVKDWPDPKLSGRPDWNKIEVVQKAEDRRDRQETLTKAGHACKEQQQKAMMLEPKKDQQKMFESMMAHAQCMRANGIAKFTNPKMQNGNAIPGGDPGTTSTEIDRDSAAYQQARRACEDKLVEDAEGMQ